MARRLADDPEAWSVLAREYLFRRPPWFTLRKERLGLPGGREIPEYWISEYPDWVNVVALTPGDEVVLVRQYRPGIAAVHYEVPAGVIDEGEAPETAGRRELLEETGYGGGRWSPIARLSANPALQTNVTHSFLAEDVERMGSPRPDATEDLRVHRVPLGDIPRLIDGGDMIQALHAAPLLRVLLGRR